MKSNVIKVIICLVIVLLLLPIISEMIDNSKLLEISYKEIQNKIEETKDYNFALIYVGEDDKEYKNLIRDLISDNKPVDKTKSAAYFVNINNLSDKEKLELFSKTEVETAYIFVDNKEIVLVKLGKLEKKLLKAYIEEFVSLGVEETIKSFIVPEDAEEYINAMNSDKVTMAVFGRDTCFYCNKFKTIYNTVAEEYELDIYYISRESNKEHVNSRAFPSKEYKKLMELDNVVVPASCSSTREDSKLSDGFSTPFTIFTKNGEVLDTLCGFVNKSELIDKMKSVGMI